MQQKIIFLLLVILGLYLVFNKKGQYILRRYAGIKVSPDSAEVM
jgi:hypothetical protein